MASRPSRWRRLDFEPYESLTERPHVMVDGAARPASVLTLSHWPQSPTPPELARDVSAESVLAYLRLAESTDSGAAPRGQRSLRSVLDAGALAEAVTNDHFDEDGLMSVYALVDPQSAVAQADLLTAVAMCGDFGVFESQAAARIAFAIAPLADAEAGPGAGTSALYAAVLPRVAQLLAEPERFEQYWAGEVLEVTAGRSALAAGEVAIAEHPDLDLAVVSRSGRSRSASGPSAPSNGASAELTGGPGGFPVHAAVVHSATTASRILSFDGQRCELYLRYEGWVKLVSRAVPLRPDLAPLAAQLSAEEPSGVTWEANGVGAVVGRLHPAGDRRSDLDPARIVKLVRGYLQSAEPAWDPWRVAGGYIPVHERPGYRARSAGRPRSRRRQP